MPKQYENDIREKINDAYSLSIGVTDLISIFTFLFFFFTTISTSMEILVFISELELKKALRDSNSEASSVVSTTAN